MRPDKTTREVYLHRAPVDMRRQIDGLAAIVQGTLKRNPMNGAIYVFINKRRDKLKILTWERNGFIVWYKRLEQQKFTWPCREKNTVITLNGEQLNWLLDGYDVMKMKPHKTLHSDHVA